MAGLRLARRRTAEIGREKGARLYFGIFGRWLAVLEPSAKRADTGLHLSHVEGMIASRVNGQSDSRAICP